jgi:hypothetical protein
MGQLFVIYVEQLFPLESLLTIYIVTDALKNGLRPMKNSMLYTSLTNKTRMTNDNTNIKKQYDRSAN